MKITELYGNIPGPGGAHCGISATEADSGESVLVFADETGNYRLALSPGSWRVSIIPAGGTPQYIGVLPVSSKTAPGALSDLLVRLSAGSLDITVLGHLYNLVQQAERAALAVDSVIAGTVVSVSDGVKNQLINAVADDAVAVREQAAAAKTSATQAKISAAEAKTSAAEIKTSAAEVKTRAAAAKTSADAAADSAASAGQSAALAAERVTETVNSLMTQAAHNSGERLADAIRARVEEYAGNAESSANAASEFVRRAETASTDISNLTDGIRITEGNAKTSEVNAKTSEVNAKTSEVNAKTSEVNARNSQTAAADSAGRADISATSAAKSASRAENFGKTDGITVPVSFTDDFNNQVKFNHYFYNNPRSYTSASAYGVETRTIINNHPLADSGDGSWGLLWTIPRPVYPAQLFINYHNKMFHRIKAAGGWTPWWQISGDPGADNTGVGSYRIFVEDNHATSESQGAVRSFVSSTMRAPGMWRVLSVVTGVLTRKRSESESLKILLLCVRVR